VGFALAAAALGVLLALGIGAVAVVFRAVSSGPISTEQNPLNTIFASRYIVASCRIAILFAAGYVVLSIIARIRAGEWLSRVGPVEVSASVLTVTRERDELAEALGEALQENDLLQANVQELTEHAETLDAYLNSVLEWVSSQADEEGDAGEHGNA
jgi:hypothetical protein